MTILSCKKIDDAPDIDKVKKLADKYDFVFNNDTQGSTKMYSISELEQAMIFINSQRRVFIKKSTGADNDIDSSAINNKIKELKVKTNLNKGRIQQNIVATSLEDPIYKYSKTLYLKNAGLIPNYAINIQYNATNGIFTSVSVSASPYGSYYFAGQFATFGQPQIYYLKWIFSISTKINYDVLLKYSRSTIFGTKLHDFFSI